MSWCMHTFSQVYARSVPKKTCACVTAQPGMSQMSDRSAAGSDSPATMVRGKLPPETPLSFTGQ